ncbi:MAG: ABC transporter substrate-binding protein [Synechococcaceae cyanobacterium]|nr:ABC transporter substrate-binding protein [Synechococcaceae cyanobacterium]
MSPQSPQRRRPQRLLPLTLLAPLLGLGLLPLAGCQPRRSGDQLVIASSGRIDSLDPAQASRQMAMQLLSALGDPLYAIEPDGTVTPRLATALPRLSADGLTARIPLRRNVRFHDGTPLDAAAMAFSLRRFMGIGTLGYQLSERVREVRVSDAHTLELQLRKPFSPLPKLLSAIFLTPVSPRAYREHGRSFLADRFVGTGPYRLEFRNDQQLRLRPWTGYWGARPANGGLDWITLSNSTALFGALRSGEVDVLLSSGLEIDHQQALHREASTGRLREAIGPAMELGLLSLLTDQAPLQDPRLRQAVAHSLDRRTINARVGLGLRPPIRQLIPPSLPGSLPHAWPSYDPAAARRLYRQAGYCRGRTLQLPLTFRSDIPTDRLFALTWQAQLRRDLGDCVSLQISGMESTTAYDQLGKGALPMLLYDWIGDYPDAENYLTPLLDCPDSRGDRCLSGNSVLSGSAWTAPGLQAALQRSSKAGGLQRVALLQAIQRRSASGVPYLPLWLVAPVAWGSPSLAPLRFDGSGRLLLPALQRQARPAGGAR